MTETEWLTATDPMPMLEYARDAASNRKLRLFAVVCGRSLAYLLGCEECQSVVAVGEHFADGTATVSAVATAYEHAHREWMNYGDSFRCLDGAASFVLTTVENFPHQVTRLNLAELVTAVKNEDSLAEADDFANLRRAQPLLLRCIFGNPFRPVAIDHSWLTSTVVALAEGIYAEKAFDRLPILADALQDAGCDHPDILTHCRGEGPHVRGCWALDLVLGKS